MPWHCPTWPRIRLQCSMRKGGVIRQASFAVIHPIFTIDPAKPAPTGGVSMPARPLAVSLFLVTALALTSCTGSGPGGAAGVRSPTFRYVKDQEGGCGDVYFHKGTADRTEVLWVSADKKK